MISPKIPKITKPRTIIKWVVILLVFLVIANPTIIPFLPDETRTNLSETWTSIFGDVGSMTSMLKINWGTIFRVGAIIILMVVISKIAAFIIEKLRPKTGKGKSLQTLMRSAVNYIAVIITTFWCLSALGVNVSTLVAGAGILTLAISFGAQSLIEDVVTGIFLVFEDQFNVGDYIEVDGFRGTVENIGIRVTTVKGPGSNYKIINNSSIKNILNRSQSSSIATTTVSVSYKEDVRHVEQVLNDLFPKMREMYPEVFLEPPKNFGIDELGDSGVVFKIAFDEAGIEIPFPQVVVHQEK